MEDFGDPIKAVITPFSQWADHVRAESSVPDEVYHEDEGSHRLCSAAESCCGLLEAIGGQRLGKQCCEEQLNARVFECLGKGTAADWQSISERLAQRVGEEAQHPAWLQDDQQECIDSVSERIRRACCSSEVAVLMLRLAVRSACLASSWYGPWESMGALQQLVKADAWASLLRALRVLLSTFGSTLSKQYNAITIVNDILHVRPGAPPLTVFLAWFAFSSSALT